MGRTQGDMIRVLKYVFLCGVVVSGVAEAEENAQKARSPSLQQPASAPSVQSAVRARSPQEKLLEEVRAKLDGTTWSLELRPFEGSEGGKKKNPQDAVTFHGTTVASERLSKRGYGPSNYSLKVNDDGTATWETMQTKEGTGVAFWRGEVQGETMRGVLSQQPTGGATENFSFSGKQTAQATPKEDAAPVQPAPASPTPEAAPPSQPVVAAPSNSPPPPQPAQPKEQGKRGWW